LNIGINFLASKQIGNDMEQQREAMLMDLQQKIIKRQKEYSQLMDSNSENPFSISDDELEMKKETLLSEIQHLKISLQQFQ
jgi:translation elongation factor P/translation initiation factor 5A